MKKKIVYLLIFLLALIFCGCEMRTVDKMYVPPRRSDDFYSLQTVINTAMEGYSYCAPSSGDHQQIVQTADLNGDHVQECLVYAQNDAEQPLHILIFSMVNNEYAHAQTLSFTGSAFDKVEYAQIDDKPGMELVVGTQVSNQVTRSVSVFSFHSQEAEQLVTAPYIKFLTVDLDANDYSELFILRAGPTETDRGVVELYSASSGVMERSVEVNMSQAADNLKRILVGKLHEGKPAVYVASAVDEDTLVTDVYAVVEDAFTNVSFSNESGTSMKTMRNYFVYADDMDSDGIMELPAMIPMRSIDTASKDSGQNMIRWYSMAADGSEVDKLYTYHNFIGGWYMQFDSAIAERISVVDRGNVCDFYIWEGARAEKLLSIHTLTGQSREEQSTSNNRFALYKGESVIYAASLDHGASNYAMTQQTLMQSFHMIHEHWNTGET